MGAHQLAGKRVRNRSETRTPMVREVVVPEVLVSNLVAVGVVGVLGSLLARGQRLECCEACGCLCQSWEVCPGCIAARMPGAVRPTPLPTTAGIGAALLDQLGRCQHPEPDLYRAKSGPRKGQVRGCRACRREARQADREVAS